MIVEKKKKKIFELLEYHIYLYKRGIVKQIKSINIIWYSYFLLGLTITLTFIFTI